MGLVTTLEVPKRGDVFLIELDHAVGREIQKARPCVVVSPNELNSELGAYIVAPLTTGGHPYPFRTPCRFLKKDGHIVLEQIRTVDRRRLLRRMGRIPAPTLSKALAVLREMFAE